MFSRLGTNSPVNRLICGPTDGKRVVFIIEQLVAIHGILVTSLQDLTGLVAKMTTNKSAHKDRNIAALMWWLLFVRKKSALDLCIPH